MKRGPKNSHRDLTQAYVKKLFDYNPNTGLLTWKVMLSRRGVRGKTAGFLNSGRLKVGINNKDYMVHRIIWLWMTGKWPAYEVDHRNQIKSDNRWKNLREATPSQNHRNKKMHPQNKSGYRGVCFDNNKGRWLVTINVTTKGQKRHIHIGWFDTAYDGHLAWQKAAEKYHGKEWMSTIDH